MSLTDFLFSPATMPFAIAIGAVLGLAVIEVAGLLFGATFGDGFEADADVVGPFDWLHLGSMPIILWLLLLAMGFGLGGYITQYIAVQVTGGFAPLWAAVAVALIGMVLVTRLGGSLLKRTLIKDETDALPTAGMVGNLATITLGETRRGMPTQAKFRDQFGTTHYVQVEPLSESSTYHHGDEVVLVEWTGHSFFVIGRDESLDFLNDPSLRASEPLKQPERTQ